MRYGTIEYAINDALESIMRIDKIHAQVIRAISRDMRDIACMGTKLLVRRARDLYPELFEPRIGEIQIPCDVTPRLIKH